MKIKAILFSLAVIFAAAVVASAQDPNMGTWKLNEAKSHFGKGAPKNDTVVYEMVGDDIKAAHLKKVPAVPLVPAVLRVPEDL